MRISAKHERKNDMKQILAVDDNPANLTLVRETLKDLYKVTVVTSGEQALRFLEKKQPDLILLDVCMPGMDGMETLREINKLPNPTWKVLFLTALADGDMDEEEASLGAAGTIPKPFKPSEMIAQIKAVIGE